MLQRGRKSAASLGVVAAIDCSRVPPPPPEHLTPEQRAVWVTTTEAMKGDWFDGCLPLLEVYCEHVSYSDQVARELNQRGSVDDHWARLAALHCAQTTAIIRAATALRLTPHSHSGARTNRHTYSGPKPWDLIVDSDEEPPVAS